ncbi:MAG: hypothetical protein ACRDHK_16045, partial [Actinomycetota bacterium]
AFLAGVSAAGWLGTSLGIRGAYAVSGAAFLLTAMVSRVLLASPRKGRGSESTMERASSRSAS